MPHSLTIQQPLVSTWMKLLPPNMAGIITRFRLRTHWKLLTSSSSNLPTRSYWAVQVLFLLFCSLWPSFVAVAVKRPYNGVVSLPAQFHGFSSAFAMFVLPTSLGMATLLHRHRQMVPHQHHHQGMTMPQSWLQARPIRFPDKMIHSLMISKIISRASRHGKSGNLGTSHF